MIEDPLARRKRGRVKAQPENFFMKGYRIRSSTEPTKYEVKQSGLDPGGFDTFQIEMREYSFKIANFPSLSFLSNASPPPPLRYLFGGEKAKKRGIGGNIPSKKNPNP